MLHLSERLEKIAKLIGNGDRVADIGTDHGYIPIYLKENGLSDYVVAGDINSGPLEKMEENLQKHLEDDREGIFMRLGGGLEVISEGEVDTVVIAGMGGLLMIDILSQEPEKTFSCKNFILQPRNAQDKLRKWLLENGFRITEEVLAEESRFVWEIIKAEPVEWGKDQSDSYFQRADSEGLARQYEVGRLLIENKDALLSEFIVRKLRIQREIADNAAASSAPEAIASRDRALNMIGMLEGLNNA